MKKILLLVLCVTQFTYAIRSLPDASTRFQQSLKTYLAAKNPATAQAVVDEYDSTENTDKYRRTFDSTLQVNKLTIGQLRALAASTGAPKAPSKMPAPTGAHGPAMAPTEPAMPPLPSAPEMSAQAPVAGAPVIPTAPPMPTPAPSAGTASGKLKNPVSPTEQAAQNLGLKQKPTQTGVMPSAPEMPAETPVAAPANPVTGASVIPTAPPMPTPAPSAGTASGKLKPALSPMQQLAQAGGAKIPAAAPTSLLSEAEDEAIEQAVIDANNLDLTKATVDQLTSAINAIKATIKPGITKDQRTRINTAIKRLADQRQKIKPKAPTAQTEIDLSQTFLSPSVNEGSPELQYAREVAERKNNDAMSAREIEKERQQVEQMRRDAAELRRQAEEERQQLIEERERLITGSNI